MLSIIQSQLPNYLNLKFFYKYEIEMRPLEKLEIKGNNEKANNNNDAQIQNAKIMTLKQV